jgi:hypothetical protein
MTLLPRRSPRPFSSFPDRAATIDTASHRAQVVTEPSFAKDIESRFGCCPIAPTVKCSFRSKDETSRPERATGRADINLETDFRRGPEACIRREFRRGPRLSDSNSRRLRALSAKSSYDWLPAKKNSGKFPLERWPRSSHRREFSPPPLFQSVNKVLGADRVVSTRSFCLGALEQPTVAKTATRTSNAFG